eukprot:g17.t1
MGVVSKHETASESKSTDPEIGYSHLDGSPARSRPIPKVFGILSLQLLLTTAIVAFCISVDNVKDWLHTQDWFIYLTFIAGSACLITLGFGDYVYKRPWNLVYLFAFTVFEGFLLGVLSAHYNTEALVLVGVITVVIIVGFTIFAFLTSIDCTGCNALLFATLFSLVGVGLIALVSPRNRGLILLYTALGAMPFSALLIHSGQMIGEGYKYGLGSDQYLEAAIMVYLDIFYVLLFILCSGNDSGIVD